jgi:hypothetical protein
LAWNEASRSLDCAEVSIAKQRGRRRPSVSRARWDVEVAAPRIVYGGSRYTTGDLIQVKSSRSVCCRVPSDPVDRISYLLMIFDEDGRD